MCLLQSHIKYEGHILNTKNTVAYDKIYAFLSVRGIKRSKTKRKQGTRAESAS